MIVTTAPELLTSELEQLPLGQPYDVLHSETGVAIAAVTAAALAVVFDDRIPAYTSDDAARYSGLTARLTAPRYPDHCAALADRARRSGLDMLFRMFLSRECLQDVEASGEAIAQPVNDRESIGEARARAAAAARTRYERLICSQLAAGTDALAEAARQVLAADRLSARVATAVGLHEEHGRKVAEQLERDRAAAQLAADQALDVAAGEADLASVLRNHRLPETLRSGEFYESQRALCILRATAVRRLSSTRVDALRLSMGQGVGLYGTRNLSRGLGDFSLGDLQSLLGVLDRAEGRDQSS